MSCHIFHKCNFWSSHWPLLGILVLTVITFWPTFSNGFQSGWDDQWQVTNSFTKDGLTRNNLICIFTNTYGGQYSPVNQLVYTILYQVVKYKPLYYHALCLILHLINIILFYIILLRLYKYPFFTRIHRNINSIALFCIVCFAINPLQVESVAWVSASKIVLFSVFYLLGTWQYLSFIEKGEKSAFIFALICFVLALGSKEQSVVFPLWLLLLHWSHGDFENRSHRLLGVIPFFILALIFGVSYLLYSSSLDGDLKNISKGYTLIERLEIAGFVIPVYIRRFFLPLDLQHIYHLPEPIPNWFIFSLICVILILVASRKIISHPIGFWLLFFIIHICLSLHLIPMGRFIIMADRYMYLPSIAVSNITFLLCQKWYNQKRMKIAYRIILSVMLLTWTITSHLRCMAWKNTNSIRSNNNLLTLFIQLHK